jgi:F-type H+-transporting ATPase subunit b
MRYGRLFLLTLFALAILLSSSALASVGTDDKPAKAGEGSGAHAKGGSEPPIFTPVRIDLAIWTLIVFLLLLAVLSRIAWNPLLEGLRKREATIRSALDEAQRAREEAERLRQEFQLEMQKANEKVRDLLEGGRKDAERTTQEMIAKARADIQGERDRLRREIDTAKDQALHDLWTQAANLATMISQKVIKRELNEQDHRRLVDEALVELRSANVDWRERNIF